MLGIMRDTGLAWGAAGVHQKTWKGSGYALVGVYVVSANITLASPQAEHVRNTYTAQEQEVLNKINRDYVACVRAAAGGKDE